MPLITTKTIREHLLGCVADFADSCGMVDFVTPNLLAYLITTLSNYREEGAKLLPEIYLFNNLEHARKLLPGNGLVKIGNGPLTLDVVRQAVKRCAPLAIGGWCIYVTKDKKHVHYGLFRGSLNPLSIPVDKTLFSVPNEDLRAVRLFQIADNCVEIRNHNGDICNIVLTDKRSEAPPPGADFDNLIDAICKKVPKAFADPARVFMSKAVKTALQHSHGTLVAVCQTGAIPKFLKDGVVLKPPIDLTAAIAIKGEVRTAESDFELMSQAVLLQGMLSSDGITVFTSDARLLAYNCFISAPAVTTVGMSGGARTRAFHALGEKLGDGLVAVFMRSQDGWTSFRSKK